MERGIQSLEAIWPGYAATVMRIRCMPTFRRTALSTAQRTASEYPQSKHYKREQDLIVELVSILSDSRIG